ncbi:PREDICTED: uncharacterized protein LOC109126066, partial [Camelina sativa]|uniref:Uncharacterized protein LOC109126066 n=1 Tax=Camelina sativa TaxID=90675 RepID=A0ABM1QD49_CAMSA
YIFYLERSLFFLHIYDIYFNYKDLYVSYISITNLLGIYGQKVCTWYRAPYARGTCTNYKHVKSTECDKACKNIIHFEGRCEHFQEKGVKNLGCYCYPSIC